jgi:hypothetical protein
LFIGERIALLGLLIQQRVLVKEEKTRATCVYPSAPSPTNVGYLSLIVINPVIALIGVNTPIVLIISALYGA